MARYELREGTSNYFWQIRLTGKVMTTSYGRVGTKGQSTTKSFDSVAKAKIAHGKLISEKVKKGYELVANTSAKKRTMAPVTATAPSAVSSRASVRSPEKVRRATLAWTPALDEAAADQRYEFEILPTKKSAATKIFGAIQRGSAQERRRIPRAGASWVIRASTTPS